MSPAINHALLSDDDLATEFEGILQIYSIFGYSTAGIIDPGSNLPIYDPAGSKYISED